MVLMLVVIIMIVVIVVMVLMLVVIIVILVHVFGVLTLHFHCLDPAGALHDFAHIEVVGGKHLGNVYLAVVGFNDFGFGLQRLDNLQHGLLFLGSDQIYLVQNDGGAVFDLLDQQIFDVLFVEVVVEQRTSRAEFIRHSLGVHNGGDAVEAGDGRQISLLLGAVKHTDGAGDGARLADAGGFNQDIVKALGSGKLDDLLHQIHLQGAADAAVLQGDEVIVFLSDGAALGNQGSVNIDFADIVDDDGHLIALLIGEDMV